MVSLHPYYQVKKLISSPDKALTLSYKWDITVSARRDGSKI